MADAKGWTLIGVECDNGKTGANTRRDGLQRSLVTLKAREADVMVVTRLDRLSRSIADFGKLLNLAEREGWRLVVLDLDLDTTTPSGWFAAHVIALASEYERRLIGQRTREALVVARANGTHLGRPSTIPPTVQRRIVRLHRNGHSAPAIARRLTADRVPTPTGNDTGTTRWSSPNPTEGDSSMTVLPDILAPVLRVVFCGTAVGERSAARGHYYAGPGNAFWHLLHDAGFTPGRLSPDDDSTLPKYGLGLTDLVKHMAQSHDRGLTFDVEGLAEKMERYRPAWLAFTSKKAGQVAARSLDHPAPGLGQLPWTVGPAHVFVLPSPSGANQRREYDGRATRLEWWAELAALAAHPSLSLGVGNDAAPDEPTEHAQWRRHHPHQQR